MANVCKSNVVSAGEDKHTISKPLCDIWSVGFLLDTGIFVTNRYINEELVGPIGNIITIIGDSIIAHFVHTGLWFRLLLINLSQLIYLYSSSWSWSQFLSALRNKLYILLQYSLYIDVSWHNLFLVFIGYFKAAVNHLIYLYIVYERVPFFLGIIAWCQIFMYVGIHIPSIVS